MVFEAPKQVIVSRPVFRPFTAGFRHIRRFHPTDNGSDDTVNKFVQYFEKIVKLAIKALGPEVLATLNINEAYRDPNPLPNAADLPLKNMFNSQLASNLLWIYALGLIGKACTA
jgi:hypothetical protein